MSAKAGQAHQFGALERCYPTRFRPPAATIACLQIRTGRPVLSTPWRVDYAHSIHFRKHSARVSALACPTAKGQRKQSRNGNQAGRSTGPSHQHPTVII
jgi:hypothetical protein